MFFKKKEMSFLQKNFNIVQGAILPINLPEIFEDRINFCVDKIEELHGPQKVYNIYLYDEKIITQDRYQHNPVILRITEGDDKHKISIGFFEIFPSTQEEIESWYGENGMLGNSFFQITQNEDVFQYENIMGTSKKTNGIIYKNDKVTETVHTYFKNNENDDKEYVQLIVREENNKSQYIRVIVSQNIHKIHFA